MTCSSGQAGVAKAFRDFFIKENALQTTQNLGARFIAAEECLLDVSVKLGFEH
jgi:hypothetical protein